MASVWSCGKGLEDYINLSRNPDFVVIIVGLNSEQVELLRGEDCKDCNLILVCRTQSQYELAMLYSLANVTLSLSYFETFGLTLVESLSCGTPVVLYDNTGQSNIPSNNTGLLIETGNVEAVAEAVRSLSVTPFSPMDCRKRALDFYDKDQCFEAYIELYNVLINTDYSK